MVQSATKNADDGVEFFTVLIKSETDQIFSFLHTFIHHHRHQTALIMRHLTKLCGALQYNKNTKAIDLARIKHT